MNARRKLNSAGINGVLIVAGVAGWAFQSWTLFGMICLVLLFSALYCGEIRGKPNKRGR